METSNRSGMSRRGLFGVGAATAGAVVAGGATKAFARDGGSGEKQPSNRSGGQQKMAESITRVPGTKLMVRLAADFYANGFAVTVDSDGLAYPSDSGVAFMEANLPLPVGSVIKQIDVFGHRLTAGTQNWYVQTYTTTTFGAGATSSLYLKALNGAAATDVQGTLPIPVGGITIDETATYAVYCTSVSELSQGVYGVAVQYVPPSAELVVIAPKRVYDSRSGAKLAQGETRTVSVATGTDATPNVIPPGAAAIAYNLTITGTEKNFGFLSVAPGGVTPGEDPSSINWDHAEATQANGLVVGVNAAREIAVRCGGVPGAATHFLVDIVGYYL